MDPETPRPPNSSGPPSAAGGPDDTPLVRRAQSGDEDAYEELVRRHQHRIYGLCYHLTSNHEDAADLAQDALLAGSQITRFLVLHKELDADDGELTRTRKVRRGAIADKYAVLIDALYEGKASQFIETLVRFEDGRTGKVAADLQIRDARTFAKGAA